MRDLAMRALDTARQRGAGYADVRIVHFRSESVAVRNRNVEALTSDESLGFGVRVIVDGYWGFAASHKMTLEEADRVAAEAVRVARAYPPRPRPPPPKGPPPEGRGPKTKHLGRDPVCGFAPPPTTPPPRTPPGAGVRLGGAGGPPPAPGARAPISARRSR